MKECLTSNPDNFGCNLGLTNSFLKKLTMPQPQKASDDEVNNRESSNENERDQS